MTPDCRSMQDAKYVKRRLAEHLTKHLDSNGYEVQKNNKESSSIYYEQ